MSGFKLAPSRLNRPAAVQETTGPARTSFAGLTASKLGLLAESKLTPPSGAIQARAATGEAREETTPPTLPTPATFTFTPLSRPAADSAPETAKPEEAAREADPALATPVFGERLAEKVTDTTAGEVTEEKDLPDSSVAGEEAEEGTEAAGTNFVASGILFTTAAKASDDESEKKTLSESAAEYTESHANKRKYDVVDVVTGEEAESNVVQSQVKLYIFDKDKRNWTERGRGLLRLNDSAVSAPGRLRSRLVVRTSGNMRVVLNTKLWPDMICEKANDKNIRISALDDGEVKIFLIACSMKEAEKLFNALEHRINQLKTEGGGDDDDEDEEEEEEGEPPEKRPAPDTAA